MILESSIAESRETRLPSDKRVFAQLPVDGDRRWTLCEFRGSWLIPHDVHSPRSLTGVESNTNQRMQRPVASGHTVDRRPSC